MRAAIKLREASLAPPKHGVQMRFLGSAVFSECVWKEIGRSLKLSGRELQIVRSIFDDYTDLAIAQQIGISLSTVHTHIESSRNLDRAVPFLRCLPHADQRDSEG